MKKIKPFRIIRAVLRRFSPPFKHKCVLCGHSSSGFLPYRGGRRHAPPLMNALHTVGSNLDLFECPWCGCHDRERHLFLYMKSKGFLPDLSSQKVLHFAPERHLSPKIKSAQPNEYIQCDLFPQSPDVLKVDMLQMPFDDDYFDLLIANHVLEHVGDDLKGVSEIFRVLKPGGYAILQTPFSPDLHKTWEDAGINSNEARLQAYGQEDHVRLFGRDIFMRFESSGLTSCVSEHCDLLPSIDCFCFGLNEREPFFLFQKPVSINTENTLA